MSRITGLKPRGFVWVIKGRLAVSERIGGHGFQHRRVRRDEELAWLSGEAGINSVVSLLPANQNLAAYQGAGLTTRQVNLQSEEVSPADTDLVFGALDEALDDPSAVVLLHREVIDDMLGGILAGYLIHSERLEDPIVAIAVVQEIIGRALSPEGRSLVPGALA